MITRTTLTLLVFGATSFLAVDAGVIHAQSSSGGTLKDIVADVRRAEQASDFATVNPANAALLDDALTRLSASHAADFSYSQLASVIASRRPSFRAIARWEPDRYDLRVEPKFFDDVILMSGVASNQLADAITQKLGVVETDRLLARIDTLHGAVLATAKAQNLEKLRRYEIKYGPKSPRLNAPEVGLNYLAQRLPGFGPTSDGWPGTLEMVATYSTTELTVVRNGDNDLRGRVVSASHFGVRKYQFGEGWGNGGGLTGILKPAHVAAGATLMGPTDRVLGSPFKRGRRMGGFVSWGDVLVGFVGGPERRVLLSRNLKVIPYLF